MNTLAKVIGTCIVSICSLTPSLQPTVYASSISEQITMAKQGLIEFRVGSIKSTVVSGARVIVINHDGKVITTGITNSSGIWTAAVPLYKVQWNENFSTKGIVTAIALANGYNEQVVFVVPITEHTIQPIVMQPVMPNARNQPYASLGLIYHQELQQFVSRYAQQVGLQRQSPIPSDFGYAPWGPSQKLGAEKK